MWLAGLNLYKCILCSQHAIGSFFIQSDNLCLLIEMLGHKHLSYYRWGEAQISILHSFMSSVWKALVYLSVFCVCVCFRRVGKCHPSWLEVERTAVINVIQYSVRVQFFSIVSKLSCSSWCVCIRIQMRSACCTQLALHLVDVTPEPLTFFHVIYLGRRVSHLSSRVSGFG